MKFKRKSWARRWWRAPLMPTLRGQRQADLCEFEASLVYRVSSRTARAVTQRNLVLKKKKRKKEKERGKMVIKWHILGGSPC